MDLSFFIEGERGINGRFIHNEGEVDIVCLTNPIPLLKTDFYDVSVVFYSNNEPYICLDRIEKTSPSILKDMLLSVELIKEKFYDLGYDKIFAFTKEGDYKGNKLNQLLGFIPVVYYKDHMDNLHIKTEMNTKNSKE